MDTYNHFGSLRCENDYRPKTRTMVLFDHTWQRTSGKPKLILIGRFASPSFSRIERAVVRVHHLTTEELLMTKYHCKLFGITLLTFIVIDLFYLSLMAPTFYRAQIGPLMASTTNWIAVGLFYLEIVAGLVVFVIMPSVQAASFRQPLARAVLFGLVSYGTYELSNLATLNGWSVSMTVVDTCWGVCVCTIASFVSLRFARQLQKPSQQV